MVDQRAGAASVSALDWEGREGEEIPVWVHSNLDEVELFLNGKSQGRQKVPRLGHVEWKVRYEPGAIEAHGWKDGKLVLTEKRETTGPVAALRLTADRTDDRCRRRGCCGAHGRRTRQRGPRGADGGRLIDFKMTGEGALIGVGNGDSNCQESDKEPRRSLFNGLAQAIVQSTKTPGTITIEASTIVRDKTVTPATITVTTRPVSLRPSVT